MSEKEIKKEYEDLKLEKYNIYEKILKYCEYFKLIKKSNITPESNLSDLENELLRLEMESNKKIDPVDSYKSLFIYSGIAIENLSSVYNPFDLDLSGLGNVLNQNKNNEEFDTSIKQLILKYDLHQYNPSSPEFRLLKFMTNSIIVVDQHNKLKKNTLQEETKKEEKKD